MHHCTDSGTKDQRTNQNIAYHLRIQCVSTKPIVSLMWRLHDHDPCSCGLPSQGFGQAGVLWGSVQAPIGFTPWRRWPDVGSSSMHFGEKCPSQFISVVVYTHILSLKMSQKIGGNNSYLDLFDLFWASRCWVCWVCWVVCMFCLPQVSQVGHS